MSVFQMFTVKCDNPECGCVQQFPVRVNDGVLDRLSVHATLALSGWSTIIARDGDSQLCPQCSQEIRNAMIDGTEKTEEESDAGHQ